MGFTQRDLGGLIVNESDNAIQWKIINNIDVIKMNPLGYLCAFRMIVNKSKLIVREKTK